MTSNYHWFISQGEVILLQVTARQQRWYRLQASGLITPFASAEEAATALVGVQAQILPAAGLALYHRVTDFDDAQLTQLLWEQKTLLKIWAQRGTLHLFPSVDWPLIVGAQSRRRSWCERKIESDGGDVAAYHRAVNAVAAMMLEQGTLGRSDLRASDLDMTEGMLSSWGGIFTELVRRGDACHAQRSGSEGAFAHRQHWLPSLEWAPPASAHANEEIARRYFVSYGPSTLFDFAYWRGVSLRDARPWVEAIQDELIEVQVDKDTRWIHRDGLALLREKPPRLDQWPMLMLYRFDPLLLGHKDKSWLVPATHQANVWRKAGHIEGTILQEGRITGTWRYQRSATSCALGVEPFAEYPEEIEDEIVEKATQIAAYFGVPCTEVTFYDPS